MFFDVVFPKGNEQEFIRIAEKLQVPGLCFAYPFTDKKAAAACKSSLQQLQEKTKVILKLAFIASEKQIYKAKDIGMIAVASATGDEPYDRELIAKYQPHIVYNLESSPKKDYIHSRRSGLNQVLCKFAAKNNVVVAISFSSVLNSKNRAQLLGRMMQNIRMCSKYRVSTAIASFASDPYDMRSPHDLQSFLLSFGMNTKKAKDSISAIGKVLQ